MNGNSQNILGTALDMSNYVRHLVLPLPKIFWFDLSVFSPIQLLIDIYLLH